MPRAPAAAGRPAAGRRRHLGLGRDGLRPDPFHLVIADPEQAALVSWDGSDLTEEKLAPGVTVVVNTGLDATAPRAAQHGPRFAATRPAPSEDVLRTSSDIREIWGDWVRLLDEAAADTAHSASGGGDDRTSWSPGSNCRTAACEHHSVTLPGPSPPRAALRLHRHPGDPQLGRSSAKPTGKPHSGRIRP